MGANDIDRLALPGDMIRKDDLLPTAEQLIEMAQSLKPDIERAESPKELAALMKANGDLLAQARVLIEADIELVVGEAKISADQVLAAVAESQKVIEKVERVRSKLAKIGAALDFVAAVLTGSGTRIFEAAFVLKDALGKP